MRNIARTSPPPAHNEKSNSNPGLELTDQTNLLPFRKVVVVFIGLSLCLLVSNLDSTVVATALPTISASFNAGTVSAWVPAAYMLTSTSFLPLYGRFSDIFGRKACLCLAMGFFMVGSLAAGFSTSIIELVVFRAIAGIGGGGIVSVAQIVISDVVSLRERGKYQGIIGVVYAFGFAIGPIMGGGLAEKVSWRWCFWITLPLSAVAICVVILVLPLKRVEGNIRRKLLVIDYAGSVLTLAACVMLLLPLNWGGITFPWDSSIVLALLVSGSVCVFLFCLWEWKGARLPMVPMYIFKHPTVTGVYIIMFINGIIFYSSLYYLPQFFQVALGYSPTRSGVFLLPSLIMQTLASWICGQIITRTGHYRMIIHVGFAIWSVGNGLLSTITKQSPKAVLVVYMLISGLGSGQTMQTTTIAAQASVPRKDLAVVTTLRNFLRQLGGTLSLAVGSTIINNSLRRTMNGLSLPSSSIEAVIAAPTLLGSSEQISALGISAETASLILSGYNYGIRTVFLLNAGLAAIATVVSILMVKEEDLSIDEGDATQTADVEMGDIAPAPASGKPGSSRVE